MPKAGKRAIIWIIAVAAILLAAVVFFGYSRDSAVGTPVIADGYVLRVTDDDVERAYFGADAAYRAAYPEGFQFTDVQGTVITVDPETYLHYSNEAVGATADGILLDIETLDNTGLTPFYRVNTGSVISRADDGAYRIDGEAGSVPLGTALYKLSDTKYLICSDKLTLQLTAGSAVDIQGYLEVSYIDRNVIRLVSADSVWYTIATDAEVIAPNGTRCCLADKRVRDTDGNVLLKMSEVLLDADAAIEVLPGEDVEWVVPRFDITTVDGDDGVSGEDGIEGEQGVEGAQGVDGTSGEDGTSGTSGASGSSGATGATGGTAGAGEDDSIVMPDFLLSAFSVDDTGFTGTLTVSDPEDRLRDDDAYNSIYVVELATGRKTLVESAFRRSGTDAFSFLTTVNGAIELSGLKTDTRYRLVVCSAYEVDGTVFERVFISKEFSTDSLGLELINSFTTETSGTVRLTKKEYSAATGARLVLYQASDFVSSDSEAERLAAVDLDASDLVLAGREITFDSTVIGSDLSPNTEYIVVLKSRDAGGSYITGETPLTFTTLKTMPVIGTPLAVTDQRSSVFTLTPTVTSDPHNSIVKYTYEIYNALTNEYLTSISTDSSEPYTLPIDGYKIERDVFYKARLKVLCDDNEKKVELTSGYSNEFIMRGTGYPVVSFSYETTYVDGNGVEMPLAPHEASNFSRVNGTLHISFSGSNIIIGSSAEDSNDPLKVRITSLDQYEETRLYYLDDTDLDSYQSANKFLDLPIIRNGLKADSSYIISVYGTVDLGDGLGPQSDFLIGSCVFQTADVPELLARWTEPTGGSNTALAVYFTLLPGADTNADDAALAASALTSMKFLLYAGASTTGTPIGSYTYVDTDPAYFASTVGDATYNASPGLLITERMFQIDATELPSTVTVVATDAVDYTYTGTETTVAGQLYNATTSGYVNSIPIDNRSTTIVKANTPPAIPDEAPLDVLRITNAEAEQYGLVYNPDLEGGTTIGFKLTPLYANDQALTRSITYYVYEKDRYTAWAATGTADNPARPGLDEGGLEASVGSTSADSGYIAQVTVGGITTSSLEDSYAVVVLAGTAVQGTVPPNYLLLEGLFTEGHQDVYQDYGEDLAWGRGWYYCFAYDAMISLNNTATATHQFPYDNANYADSGVNILHGFHSANFQDPVFVCYPYTSNTNDALLSRWGYYLTDVDHALLNTHNLRISRGGTASFQTLAPSPVGAATLQLCSIYTSTAGTDVSTQLRHYDLYSQIPNDEFSTIEAFSYKQKATGTLSTSGISVTVTDLLSSYNKLELTLYGAEATLLQLAGLMVTVTDSANNSVTLYPRLTTQAAIVGETQATATATILSSQLTLASGPATMHFYALYDTNISGFSFSPDHLYAIQDMDSSSLYLVPANNDTQLTDSFNGANNSVFEITSFTATGSMARLGYRSKTSPLSGTLAMDMTPRGVYALLNTDYRLTLKQLGRAQIGEAGGTSITIVPSVPFVNLDYTAEITASLDRVSFTYRIEGAVPGAITDDTVYIRLYQKHPTQNNWIPVTKEVTENGVPVTVPVTLAQQVNFHDATVYTGEIQDLSRGTEYMLEFYAYMPQSGGETAETLLLRLVGEDIQSAQYEFATVSQVNISDIGHLVQLTGYSDKTLVLTYKLDRTFGFHIEINLQKWNPTGGEDGLGAYEPYADYDELYATGTMPQQYAANELYSSEMDCDFVLTAGKLIEPGGNYRFEIVAIANALDDQGDEVILGTGYHEYRRALNSHPIFSVMSEARYAAPVEEGVPGTHSITYTIMPGDAQKVIVGGTYIVRLFDANGVMVDLTEVDDGNAAAAHSIGSAYTFTVSGLSQSTNYTLHYYAVTDLPNTGLDADSNPLESIDQMLAALSPAQQAELLAPVIGGAPNPYILGSKTQKTLGASGIEIGILSVSARPGTTSYLRLVFTGAYGIASVDELTPGPIVRVEYMIATPDLSFSQLRTDSLPQITLLTGGNTSNFVYNLEPSIEANGSVYYVTVRLYTAESGDTPAYIETLPYFS